MNFNPKDATNLLPDGEYHAQVAVAEEKKSNAGNDMIKLRVRVFGDGRTPLVDDYIVNPSTLYKLKKLCMAGGIGAKFEAGEINAADLVDLEFTAVIKTQVDKTGQFEDKNIITGYKPVTGTKAKSREPGSDDDDIRF